MSRDRSCRACSPPKFFDSLSMTSAVTALPLRRATSGAWPGALPACRLVPLYPAVESLSSTHSVSPAMPQPPPPVLLCARRAEQLEVLPMQRCEDGLAVSRDAECAVARSAI